MKEIVGDLWDFYAKPSTIILITTNGKVRRDGRAVMGRGCAKEATQRFADIAKTLGELIEQYGNIVQEIRIGVWAFPVKHSWEMDADMELIKSSARQLAEHATDLANLTFILPRPGCGNGRLGWEDVKKVIEPILPDNVWVITKKGR